MNFNWVALLFLFTTGALFAQESLDLRFLSTQRTVMSPFSIPVGLNTDGEISLGDERAQQDFTFNPVLQIGFTRAHIQYSQPVIINRFNFYPQQKDLGWIEVKRQRIEAGLGIGALVKDTLALGLVPYKGAMQTLVRHKSSKSEKSLPFRMPRIADELDQWNVGDYGLFQTYGGISLFANVGVSVLNIADLSVGIQNQFMIEIKKVAESTIVLKIAEEDLKRQQITLGPFFSEAAAAQFQGEKLTYEFSLDLANPIHRDLYRDAINGDLKRLQETLPFEQQLLTWKGKDKSFYFGIPVLAGIETSTGHYDFEEDGVETELDIRGTRNKGYFTSLSNNTYYVYQNEKNILLVWTSEMNKGKAGSVRKHFFNIGNILGVKGFNREFPNEQKFGSVVSQIGLSFTREELDELREENIISIANRYYAGCVESRLSCRHEKRFNRNMRKLKALLKKSWEEMRSDFGKLMIKEPALLSSIVKTMQLKKTVYFKFLSEKYQSLEGSSAIEL